MSEYTVQEVCTDDPDEIVQALKELGYEDIELHEEAVDLVAYNGSLRKERKTGRPVRGNIIVRRQHIGGASNDLGFRREDDGTYTMYESDYDVSHLRAKHGFPFKEAMARTVTANKSIREAKRQGFKVKKRVKNKHGMTVKLKLERWR